MQFKDLYTKAKSIISSKELGKNTVVAQVGCALETVDGNVFLGVNIDTACSMGFCAEANAIGAMITAGETKIKRLIAVSEKHDIVPPCGRCREFMVQIDKDNLNAQIELQDGIYTLIELLPHRWGE